MGAFGQLQLSGQITVQGIQVQIPNLIAPLVNGISSAESIVLQTGANTIPVPTGATWAIIVLPPNNSIQTTVKGVTGDTGLPMQRNGFMFYPFDSNDTPASFVLTSASTQAAPTTILFN